LYYFDHYTSPSLVTKAAMPRIAVGLGLIPHFIRRMGSLFVLSSLAAGVGGGFVLFNIATTLFSPTSHFATKVIGLPLVTFCLSAITSGVLTVSDLYSQVTRRFAT
jgi:cytochrome bd-type quinol oxidase subunit 1